MRCGLSTWGVFGAADYKEKQEFLQKGGLVTTDMQLRMEKAKEAASTRAFPDLDGGKCSMRGREGGEEEMWGGRLKSGRE